jgi:hypothetical protein
MNLRVRQSKVATKWDRRHTSQLLQPSPPCFQCIYLPHNFFGKNDVFALLRREICLCLVTVEQDSRDHELSPANATASGAHCRAGFRVSGAAAASSPCAVHCAPRI